MLRRLMFRRMILRRFVFRRLVFGPLRGFFAGMHRGQRGQAAIFLIFISILVAATAAIAVDVGFWVKDRRHAQNDVDSVVLAAVLELPEPGTASATAIANQWAAKNNVDPAELECCTFEDRDGDGRADTVRAKIHRQSRSYFSRIIGFDEFLTINVKAAAMRVKAYGSSVLPWGVEGNSTGPFWGIPGKYIGGGAPLVFHSDKFCQKKECNIFLGPGNYNALAVDGNGMPPYRNAIINQAGSQNVIVDGSNVAIPSETGTFGGNTCEPLYQRTQPLEGNVPACGPGGDSGTAPCDVSSAGGVAQARLLADNAICRLTRVVVIPVIDGFEQGKKNGTVFGLATFYIAGWDRTNPYGNYDYDGDQWGEYVWGYLLPDEFVMPAMKLLVDPSKPGTSLLAPVVAVLIE